MVKKEYLILQKYLITFSFRRIVFLKRSFGRIQLIRSIKKIIIVDITVEIEVCTLEI